MKTSKKILGLSIIAMLGASSFNAAQAADLKARAGVGTAFYELETPQIYGVIEAVNTSLTVGLTAGFGEFYVDGKFDTTIAGAHNTFVVDEDFQRDEITITAGYSVSESMTIFGGYKSTETSLMAPPGFGWSEDNFQAKGLFAGAAAGFPMGNDASLSANVAVALLTGDYTDSTFLATTGDTVGVSVGLTYNRYLSDTTGIAITGSYQGYAYDMGPDTLGVPEMTDQVMVENYLNLGISYFMGF